MIKESVAQLLAQSHSDDHTKQPFVVSPDGHIGWRDAFNPAAEPLSIALLRKGDDIYNPVLDLLHKDELTTEQADTLLARLQIWWAAHKQAQLVSLLNLQHTEAVAENVGAILRQLYDSFGMMPRAQVQDLIKSLEAEQRQVLRKRGVQLGAFFVFARDALKPACMNLKATLYRVFYGLAEAGTKLPNFGNVTMVAPEGAPADFYKAVGYPLFGNTMLRIDMAERLNTAVYDGAVEGKYKFVPSLASTVGVGVEVAKTMLRELGFNEEVVTEQVTKTVPAAEEGGEPTETTEEAQVFYYHLKRRAPKILGQKRAPERATEASAEKRTFKKPDAQKSNKQFDNKKFDKKKAANKFGEKPRPIEKPQAPKGHQAFAELLALKERMGQ